MSNKLFKLTDGRPWYKQLITGILLVPYTVIVVSIVIGIGTVGCMIIGDHYKMILGVLGFVVIFIACCFLYDWAKKPVHPHPDYDVDTDIEQYETVCDPQYSATVINFVKGDK